MRQRDVAQALGVTDRQVRRYEASARKGWTPALGPLSGAVFGAYREERRSQHRVQLLALYGRLACEQARLSVAENELDALRKVIGPGMLALPEHSTPPEPLAPTSSSPPPEPPPSSRFSTVDPAVASRALDLLRRLSPEPGSEPANSCEAQDPPTS
jgi:hypothetical protein